VWIFICQSLYNQLYGIPMCQLLTKCPRLKLFVVMAEYSPWTSSCFRCGQCRWLSPRSRHRPFEVWICTSKSITSFLMISSQVFLTNSLLEERATAISRERLKCLRLGRLCIISFHNQTEMPRLMRFGKRYRPYLV
jgi:hypothetical protein